jgi:hypothetical protein
MPSNRPNRVSERELAALVTMLGKKTPRIILLDHTEKVPVDYDYHIEIGDAVPYDAESWLTDGFKTYADEKYRAFHAHVSGHITAATYAVKIFGGDGYNMVFKIYLWPGFEAESLREIITLYDGAMGSPNHRQPAPASRS